MPKTARKKERRRYSRSRTSQITPILWEDENGREHWVQGRLIDVSVSGAKIWVPIRLPARALVTFNCAALAVGGRGTVRYCNVTKGGFEAGLELGNGTGWRDQNMDLRNLAAGVNAASQSGSQKTAWTETATEEAPKAR
jgi:hypothetical protein